MIRRLVAVLPCALLLGFSSPHSDALEQHRDSPVFAPESLVGPAPWQLASRPREADGIVMGYLPYWEQPASLPWESLDILAWFSAEVAADGSITNDRGWTGPSAAAAIEAAHAVGAKVVLSATRFGDDELAELLRDETSLQAAVDNLVARMLAGGGDGVDIDFEGMAAEDRERLVDFVQRLRAALDAAQPGSLLTMATPAVDWTDAYDYAALAESADVLFIMGYAFAGGWSNPKPNAPLEAGNLWGSRDLTWSVRDYTAALGDEAASKLVLGLPLYGHTWDAEDGSLGGAAAADGDTSSTFWGTALAAAAIHGSEWEPVSATRWSAWDDGGWKQMWFEDVESIGLKAEMARAEGAAGFGFWALGYDDGDADLWAEVASQAQAWEPPIGDDDDVADDDDALDDDDATEPANSAPVAIIDAPSLADVGERVSLDGSASHDPDGDTITFAWVQESGPEAALFGASTAAASIESSAPGAVVVRLTVSDGELQSTDAVVVTVDGEPTDGAACACQTAGSPLPLLLLLGVRRRR